MHAGEEMYSIHISFYLLAEYVRRISTNYDTVNVELTGPHSHFEEVRLEPNSAYETVPNSTFTNDPQYEEIGGGVTKSGDVAMEENPAYQPLNVTSTAKTKEGPTYQNVRVASS